MVNPLWNLANLRDARAEAARQPANQAPDDSAYDHRCLEDRLDRLALICMAMWSLVQSETNLTEEDLLQRVKEIDLMDGNADGRITRQVVRCGKCDRPMSSRHTRCIYCGSENLSATAFDTV